MKEVKSEAAGAREPMARYLLCKSTYPMRVLCESSSYCICGTTALALARRATLSWTPPFQMPLLPNPAMRQPLATANWAI